jgi:hypothetical protein
LNWFYEAIAHELQEDLTTLGIRSRLITPQELLGSTRLEIGSQQGILIVSAAECLFSLAGPANSSAGFDAWTNRLRDKLKEFHRRMLLNLDGIHTSWFQNQMSQIGDAMTHVLDLGMVPQTTLPKLGGLTYVWSPESFTLRHRQNLTPYDADRPIPWTMVGHATQERAEVVDALSRMLGAAGTLFLPPLRPFGSDGARNLSEQSLDRVLARTQYYVWASHHLSPYHECLRALHAVRNGAVPVKIDPLFYFLFQEIPWVHASVDAFLAAIETQGRRVLYNRAKDFLMARDTFGSHVAGALGLRTTHNAARADSADNVPPPHGARGNRAAGECAAARVALLTEN